MNNEADKRTKAFLNLIPVALLIGGVALGVRTCSAIERQQEAERIQQNKNEVLYVDAVYQDIFGTKGSLGLLTDQSFRSLGKEVCRSHRTGEKPEETHKLVTRVLEGEGILTETWRVGYAIEKYGYSKAATSVVNNARKYLCPNNVGR